MSFSRSHTRRVLRTACMALLALGLVDLGLDATPAQAQSTMQGVPNAMQGFSQNRDQPIQIEAASLEVRDKKKEAVFSGNVKVVQGDTTMSAKTLVVFYDQPEAGPPQQPKQKGGKAAPGAPIQQAQPGPTGSSSIKRLEARGNVVVTQKQQVVTGDLAIVDTKANLMTMTGGVVLTQCKNVLKGDRLLVDMTTGTSRVESDSGRVQGLFLQGQDCAGTTSGAPGAPPAPAPGIGSLLPGKQK
jgi:lipopolysaccharide export system protein LptA